MMNRRTWIAGITVTSLLAALLTACKQEQREQEMRQTLPVMVVSSRAVEFQESYSASIRGRQDVDIVPQVSGRITRLCVKEGEQVKTGQVLAVIDQVPYQAALRTAQANVSAAQAKVKRHGSSCKASKPCLMRKSYPITNSLLPATGWR